MTRILLVGDYNEAVIAHTAIRKALALAAKKLSLNVEPEWIATGSITAAEIIGAKKANAIWCVPGSPYASMEGALMAIRYARENNVPFLGTCGGFQHALIEYARNVLNIKDAEHAESSPESNTPVIARLACSLINTSEIIRLIPKSRLARIYGASTISEAYQCSYGLNPEFQTRLESRSLKFSAFNHELGVRAFEVTDHPFFIGTLFQPERSAATGASHPLIEALIVEASSSPRFAG